MRNFGKKYKWCELNETSFEEAIYNLGAIGDVSKVTLIVGECFWGIGERLRQKYKCQVHNVPEELLRDIRTWGATYNGSGVGYSQSFPSVAFESTALTSSESSGK